MKRITQQLLQYILNNRQQQIKHRQQLIWQHSCKSHVHEQQDKPAYPNDSSDSANTHPKKVYHQGNSKYDITRRELYNWIAASDPTHFLTVQFPMNIRSPSFNASKNNLRKLMARFEQYLIGSRWAKSHLPFYAFAEIGPKNGYTYHFHILFNAGKYNTEQIQNALNKACLQLSLPLDTIYLEKVETYEIIYYCLKEVKIANRSGCYDSIILSSDLFNISVK